MGIRGRGKSSGKRVGLALSSGAARGLAHIGVLAVLEREGIPIDIIAGTSMGALVGALYAQGRGVDEMEGLAGTWGAKRLALFVEPTLSKTGLIMGRKIEGAFKSIIGDVEFRDLGIPFACVATDVDSGEEVVIKRGLVREGIRASSSIPVLLAVAKWEGRYLVDGSLVNPVPVSVLREMGADFIIAVNVRSDIQDKVHRVNEGQLEHKEPNIFSIIMQTVHIAGYQALRASLSGADVLIEPQVSSIGFFDFHRSQECFLKGVLAAEEAVVEIKRRLGP